MIMKELLAVMCRREEVVYKEIVYERVNAVIRRMTDNNTLKTYVELLDKNKNSVVIAPGIEVKLYHIWIRKSIKNIEISNFSIP